MPRSEAQKRADKKYRMKKLSDGTQKQFNLTLRGDDYNMIDTYCKNAGISKAAAVVRAIRYCMDNGIDLTKTDTVNQENNADNI